MKAVSLFFCLLLSLTSAQAKVNVDQLWTGQYKNHLGEQVSLEQFKSKVIILEWLNHECPFIKKHYHSKYKNMQKLQEQAKQNGLVWLSVISSAPGKQGHVSSDQALKDYEKHGSQAAMVILDENGELGRAFGAKTTPHMFIISKSGQLLYQGAIDDNSSADENDIVDSKNYVAAALEQLKKGNEDFVVKKTSPYGCSVKY